MFYNFEIFSKHITFWLLTKENKRVNKGGVTPVQILNKKYLGSRTSVYVCQYAKKKSIFNVTQHSDI